MVAAMNSSSIGMYIIQVLIPEMGLQPKKIGRAKNYGEVLIVSRW